MSYSSKLMTLRALVSQLRTLVSELESPDLTIMDYFMMQDLLDKVVVLKKVIDGKRLVLELDEDEEGSILGYNLVVADSEDPRNSLSRQEIDSLAPGCEAMCKESVSNVQGGQPTVEWIPYSYDFRWPHLQRGEADISAQDLHKCSRFHAIASGIISGHDPEEKFL